MGQMFARLFATVASFATAFELFGSALINVAKVTEEHSGTWVDEARLNREILLEEAAIKRAAKRKALLAQTKADLKQAA
jgi:hypothetical protein